MHIDINNLNPIEDVLLSIKNAEYSHDIVYDITEAKRNKRIKKIRQYDKYFEFVIVKDYEDVYKNYEHHCIIIGDISVNLMVNSNIFLVSYEFSKDKYDITDIFDWLDKYNVALVKDKNNNFISYSNSIKEGILFKDNPIILYEKGAKELVFNKKDFTEVTENYISNHRQIDFEKKIVKDLQRCHYKIIFNGEEINFIPHIDFDMGIDLIISNGNIIVADYIDGYAECLAYYSNDFILVPIAWVHNPKYCVYLDIYTDGKKRVAMIKYEDAIDINDMFFD